MSNLHQTNGQRHSRLFELLRQKNVANTRAEGGHDLKMRRINHVELEEIKRISAQSMHRMN